MEINTSRRAVVQRLPACDTDAVMIYTQTGNLMATRYVASDAAAARVLARYGVPSWNVDEVSGALA